MRQFRRIVAVTITLLSALPGTVLAQTPNAPPPVLSVPTQTDVDLMRKAFISVQQNPISIASDVKVVAFVNGVQMTINETIKVKGRFPGRFRSEVTLLDEDGVTPAVKLEVVGDGKTVWTYRPDTKQYSVQTVEAFQKDATPLIGIVGALVASGDPWLGEDTPVAQIVEALKTGGMILESGAGENGRRIISLRPVSDTAAGFRVQGSVDPLTGSFMTMKMNGKEGALRFTFTETVRSLGKLPEYNVVPFTPPLDATKVAKISVWPN